MRADTVLAADGSAVATIHVETEADNAAAVMALGQISIPYVTANQTLEIAEAYTRKADGTKIPVDVSAIYDQLPPGTPGAPMITDLHVKTIVFPQFAVGDTAVYTAKLVTNHAIFPGQYWGGDAFLKQVAFDDAEETLTAPRDLPLHVENHGVAFEKSQKDGQTVYRWRYSAPASAVADFDSVHPLAHLPHYFVSTFPDYAALGRAYAQAAAPASAVTPTIKALADKITKGVSDRRAVARALYEWVAGHIRYVAIELGKGSLVPHPADAVLANGYGDCKDHVALLAALLRAEGITSESVLLNALSDYDLAGVASFAGLDHVITYVPDLDLYLDSTGNVASFGVLPFNEYGKPAVFASETSPRLGKIPVLPPGLASENTKTVSHLSRDGVLTGTTTTTASGPYAIQLRTLALAVQAIGPEAAAKRLLELHGFGGNSTGSLEMSSPTELADSYTITGTFKADDWSSEAAGTKRFYLPGGMRLLDVSGDGLMGSFFGRSAAKPDEETPCYNGAASEDISLEAPAGERFSGIPSDTHVQTANIRFDAHWTLDGQTLSVHRSFASSIDRPLCTAAIRAANAEALKTIGDSYNDEIWLESSKRDDKKASYETDIANPPNDPKLAAALKDAFVNMQQKHDDAAIAQFSAILAQPSLPISASTPARYGRAMLYIRNRRADDALADVNAALALTPKDARMLVARAYVYFMRADFKHALEDCNVALEDSPGNAFGLHVRANVSMEMGQYQDAVRDYTAELQVMKDPAAHVLRAVAYHRLGRESDAMSDIAQADANGDKKFKAMYDSIANASSVAKHEASDRVISSAADPIHAFNEPGITPPTAANDHQSHFPPLSVLLGEAGSTRVGMEVAVDGSVSNPVIEKSSGFPTLDTAALESVRSWRYNPARRDGKPVGCHYSANIDWMAN
ncbi:MAG TPA: TonB family protein [Rhizomicrobium sp.]|nr:TonB family protein [Rhizomicrobium sp.]